MDKWCRYSEGMNTAPKPTASLRRFIRESLRLGSFFFSDSTMEFFSSKAHGGFYELDMDNPYRGYFITSEQYDEETGRTYTVRFAESATEVNTLSEFGEYKTYEEALNFITAKMRKEITA